MSLALAILLGGCGPAIAVGPGEAPVRHVEITDSEGRTSITRIATAGATSVFIPFSTGAVWAVLPQVYAELGMHGAAIEERRHIFAQPRTTVRRTLARAPLSTYLDCGSRAGIPNADSYNVTLTVVTQLQPDGEEGTQLRTSIEASARAAGSSDPHVRCGSTNALEQRIPHGVLLAAAQRR
jgi:hypothetical protein